MGLIFSALAGAWSVVVQVLARLPFPLAQLPESSEYCNESASQPAMAWHPTRQLLAFSKGGTGLICFYDPERRQWEEMTLSHQFHKDVRALAWSPRSLGVLAVAVRGGVCLWTVFDSFHSYFCDTETLFQSQPGFMIFIPHPSRVSVDAVSFSPCGRWLAFGSRRSNKVVLYDTRLSPTQKGSTRTLIHLGGARTVGFSHSGRLLVVAGPRKGYNVFITDNNRVCHSERHKPLTGWGGPAATWRSTAFRTARPIRQAVWGDGDVLCLVEENSLAVSFVRFQVTVSGGVRGTPQRPISVADGISTVPPFVVTEESRVDLVTWDAASQKLVVHCRTPDVQLVYDVQESDGPFPEVLARYCSCLPPLNPAEGPVGAAGFSVHSPDSVCYLAVSPKDSREVYTTPLRYIPRTEWNQDPEAVIHRWRWAGASLDRTTSAKPAPGY